MVKCTHTKLKAFVHTHKGVQWLTHVSTHQSCPVHCPAVPLQSPWSPLVLQPPWCPAAMGSPPRGHCSAAAPAAWGGTSTKAPADGGRWRCWRNTSRKSLMERGRHKRGHRWYFKWRFHFQFAIYMMQWQDNMAAQHHIESNITVHRVLALLGVDLSFISYLLHQFGKGFVECHSSWGLWVGVQVELQCTREHRERHIHSNLQRSRY